MASVIGFIMFAVVARCVWTATMIGKTVYEHREERTPVK